MQVPVVVIKENGAIGVTGENSLFMYGFVFGTFESIAYRTQVEIEESITLRMMHE